MRTPLSVPDPFWHQPTAARALRQAARQQRLARCYLFTGPDGVGKWAVAHWMAQALLCTAGQSERPCGTCDQCRRVAAGTHPDWRILFPVPKDAGDEDIAAALAARRRDPYAIVHFKKRPWVTMDRIRALIVELSKTAIEHGAKVTLIAGANQMAGDAQTILLKTIEEPPRDAYFVLTSSDPARLLPTVVSRCQTIRFAPVDPGLIAKRLHEEQNLDPAEAETVALLCGGGWGKAAWLAQEESIAWRRLMTTFYEGAFRVGASELLAQVDSLFNPRRRVGFDQMLAAFDVWGMLLRRDCARLAGAMPAANGGAVIPDPETGWACWRILLNGRGTLYVNVAARHVVAGTFLSLRRRLHGA